MKAPRLVRMAQLTGQPRAVPPVPGIIPLEVSTIWRMVKAGEFPQPIRLGKNSVAWDMNEVSAWLDERMEQRA